MREILFRGKRKVCDEWVYGFPFISRKGEYKIKWYDVYYGSSKTSEIYTESIGQFTGLTDKNGKKIFEGDICRFREWNKGEMCWVGKVYWEHQQFMIVGGPNKECETMFELCMSRFIPENIEVIGNIHDSPELLENP